MSKIFKFIFFWWKNGSPLRNHGKIIISRIRFHKLYKLPINSIKRDSKHLKYIRINGLNITEITTKL